LIAKPKFNIDSLYLRYTLTTDQPQKLHQLAKEQGIILGNWYNSVIAPADIDLTKTGYQKNSCPRPESLAEKSLNLPTNRFVTEAEAKKIVKLINSFNN